ncbi:MAG: acetylornithine carbamoyltransferase [Daejeonella sp.]
MKQFLSVKDVRDLEKLVQGALTIKKDPFAHQQLGKNKTLGLVFLNPSLRTRLSTQKAGLNLGMNVMVMNMDKDGWTLETQDGVIMNGDSVEHIREAAAVMGQYCDILGLRSFPKLKNREEDYSEDLFNKFVTYCKVPVISLESATLHPLQSLADLITIQETWNKLFNSGEQPIPKVVLTWAPHVKALPQAVANSFSEWMCKAQENGLVDFVITHPQGYELAEEFTQEAKIIHDQNKALEDADFIYVKNWSAYTNYGQVLTGKEDWMLTTEKLKDTNNAKVMHCLPVRRDLELASEILDGPNSLVIEQAGNRVWAAQVVLKQLIEIC